MGRTDSAFGNRTRRRRILLVCLGALLLLLLCVVIMTLILCLTDWKDQVDSTEVIKEQILYRLVTQPFKVRAVKGNGAGRDELPHPGDPPFEGFRAEVLSVDFEKTFDMLNKVIYAYEIEPKAPNCPGGDNCTGTREVLIPGPETGVPFPAPQGQEGEQNSLEGLVQDLDPSFKLILDVDATMVERDEILQEVTYKWVSDPKKTLVRLQPNVTVDVSDIVKDQDQDGQIDEDPADGVDNDGDGAIDEDPPLAPGQEIEILDTDIGVGEDAEQEQLAPLCRNQLACVALVVVAVLLVGAILVILFLLIWEPNGPRPRQYPVKVLCGVLKVDNNNLNDGDATITFQPHGVGGDVAGTELNETGDGAGKPYSTKPCVHISATRIENVQVGGRYNIRCSGLTRSQVQVSWDANSSQIYEISYMVVGITEE